MAKQTAVEWLINTIDIDKTDSATKGVIEQAKAMEKEQMCDFYVEGCEDTYGIDEEGEEGSDRKSAIIFYNETFKGGEDGSTN